MNIGKETEFVGEKRVCLPTETIQPTGKIGARQGGREREREKGVLDNRSNDIQ